MSTSKHFEYINEVSGRVVDYLGEGISANEIMENNLECYKLDNMELKREGEYGYLYAKVIKRGLNGDPDNRIGFCKEKLLVDGQVIESLDHFIDIYISR